MKQLIEFYQDKNVRTILDLGTGPGNFIRVLNQVFPEATITGVDPDDEALDAAGKEFPTVVFKTMKGEKLGFNNNSFDVASISMVLHHLSDVQQTFAEMKRVVKKGGWIIVNELFSDDQNPAQEVHKQMHHFRSKIDRMKGIVHNEAFTRKQIVDQIESAGLDIELKFEYKNPVQTPTAEEILERKEKLRSALESIKGRAEYELLAGEISPIEAALDKYGFEMSTRLICVARV